MTPDERDELLAAVLDGEATDAERAQVDAEPALRGRLAAMTAARDALADVPGPPEGLLDQLVGRAVDELPPAPADDVAPVVSLADRRRVQARWLSRAAVALVVLAVAGGTAVVVSTDGSDDTDTAAFDTTADDGDEATRAEVEEAAPDAADDAAASEMAPAEEEAADGAAGSADEEERNPAFTTTVEPLQGDGIVDVADFDELADVLRSRVDRRETRAPTPPPTGCQQRDAVVEAGGIDEVFAVVDGVSLLAITVEDRPGSLSAVVFDGCDVVEELDL